MLSLFKSVQSFQKYLASIFCNAKVEIVDEKMGSCSKCDMFQPIIHCMEKLSARLYIQEGDQYLNLSAFDEILTTIAGTTNVNVAALLESKPCKVITYENIII